jgi:hypothetical protein
MNLPWGKRGKDGVKLSKKAENAAAQLRDENNRFAPAQRESAAKVREVQDQAKQIETETQMFSGIAKGMTAIEELVQARQQTIESAIQKALEDYDEPDGQEDVWAPIVKELIPMFKDYLMKGQAGSTPAIPSPSTPSPPGAPPSPQAAVAPQFDVLAYMKLAAQASKVPGGMTALKAALPTAFEEMKKMGVDPEKVFIPAVRNISKALA